jgi:ribosome modulation factor
MSDADFAAEVRRHKAERKADERYEREVQRAQDDGRTAYCAGLPLEACRLKKGHKRNAWLRGWTEAKRQTDEWEAVRRLPESEKVTIRARLAEIKAGLIGAT